jgi:phosphopantetheinyl transferase
MFVRKDNSKSLPPAKRRERRSPTRPDFVDGWRKALQAPRSRPHVAAPAIAGPATRIDVWVANPVELLRHESSLQVLSEEDWAAINRIQDPTNRRSSIAARILLRIALSRSADHEVAPSDWRFELVANDKPEIATGLPQMHFSASHVDQLAVVATSAALEIGIDVECIDQNVSKKTVADFCHLDEQLSVGGLSRPQETREFLRLWTLKEAYTKMLGLGHTLDFKMLKFTFDPVRLSTAAKSQHDMQFDNFYVSYRHSLFIASLAVHRNKNTSSAAEVQIISLALDNERDAALVLPLSG